MDQKSADEINAYYAVRTTAVLEDLQGTPSSMSGSSATGVTLTDFPTSCMTTAQLLWIQRLVLAEQDVIRYGIRNVDVWLGGDSPETAIFTPLPHAEIVKNLDSLITDWVTGYDALRVQGYDGIVSSIAGFHYEFLRIHPFLDGNGRVARALLRQQIMELLGIDAPNIFVSDPNEYYESLKHANTKDLGPLAELLKRNLAKLG